MVGMKEKYWFSLTMTGKTARFPKPAIQKSNEQRNNLRYVAGIDLARRCGP